MIFTKTYRAAGILLLTRPTPDTPQHILLVEHNTKGLNLPCGKKEMTDLNNPIQTALREFCEETNNLLNPSQLESNITRALWKNIWFDFESKSFFFVVEHDWIVDLDQKLR